MQNRQKWCFSQHWVCVKERLVQLLSHVDLQETKPRIGSHNTGVYIISDRNLLQWTKSHIAIVKNNCLWPFRLMFYTKVNLIYFEHTFTMRNEFPDIYWFKFHWHLLVMVWLTSKYCDTAFDSKGNETFSSQNNGFVCWRIYACVMRHRWSNRLSKCTSKSYMIHATI